MTATLCFRSKPSPRTPLVFSYSVNTPVWLINRSVSLRHPVFSFSKGHMQAWAPYMIRLEKFPMPQTNVKASALYPTSPGSRFKVAMCSVGSPPAPSEESHSSPSPGSQLSPASSPDTHQGDRDPQLIEEQAWKILKGKDPTDSAVKFLKDAYDNAVRKNDPQAAYIFDKGLVKLLLYTGKFDESLNRQCLKELDSPIKPSDRKLYLFKALAHWGSTQGRLHAMFGEKEKAEEWWGKFKNFELTTGFEDSQASRHDATKSSQDPLSSMYWDFMQVLLHVMLGEKEDVEKWWGKMVDFQLPPNPPNISKDS